MSEWNDWNSEWEDSSKAQVEKPPVRPQSRQTQQPKQEAPAQWDDSWENEWDDSSKFRGEPASKSKQPESPRTVVKKTGPRSSRNSSFPTQPQVVYATTDGTLQASTEIVKKPGKKSPNLISSLLTDHLHNDQGPSRNANLKNGRESPQHVTRESEPHLSGETSTAVRSGKVPLAAKTSHNHQNAKDESDDTTLDFVREEILKMSEVAQQDDRVQQLRQSQDKKREVLAAKKEQQRKALEVVEAHRKQEDEYQQRKVHVAEDEHQARQKEILQKQEEERKKLEATRERALLLLEHYFVEEREPESECQAGEQRERSGAEFRQLELIAQEQEAEEQRKNAQRKEELRKAEEIAQEKERHAVLEEHRLKREQQEAHEKEEREAELKRQTALEEERRKKEQQEIREAEQKRQARREQLLREEQLKNEQQEIWEREVRKAEEDRQKEELRKAQQAAREREIRKAEEARREQLLREEQQAALEKAARKAEEDNRARREQALRDEELRQAQQAAKEREEREAEEERKKKQHQDIIAAEALLEEQTRWNLQKICEDRHIQPADGNKMKGFSEVPLTVDGFHRKMSADETDRYDQKTRSSRPSSILAKEVESEILDAIEKDLKDEHEALKSSDCRVHPEGSVNDMWPVNSLSTTSTYGDMDEHEALRTQHALEFEIVPPVVPKFVSEWEWRESWDTDITIQADAYLPQLNADVVVEYSGLQTESLKSQTTQGGRRLSETDPSLEFHKPDNFFTHDVRSKNSQTVLKTPEESFMHVRRKSVPTVESTVISLSTELAGSGDPRSSTFIDSTEKLMGSKDSPELSGFPLSPLDSDDDSDGEEAERISPSDFREDSASYDSRDGSDHIERVGPRQLYINGEKRDGMFGQYSECTDDEQEDDHHRRRQQDYSPSGGSYTSYSNHDEDDVHSDISRETVDSAESNWTMTDPMEKVFRAFGMAPSVSQDLPGYPMSFPPQAAYSYSFNAYTTYNPNISPFMPGSSSSLPHFDSAPFMETPAPCISQYSSPFLRKHLYPYATGTCGSDEFITLNNLDSMKTIEIKAFPQAESGRTELSRFSHDLLNVKPETDDKISNFCKFMSEKATEAGSLDCTKREEGLMWTLLSLLVRHGTNVRNFAISDILMSFSRDPSMLMSSASSLYCGTSSENYLGERKLAGVRRSLCAGLIPRACKTAEEIGRTPLAFMLVSLPSVTKTNNKSALASFMRYVDKTISPADPIYTACALMCGASPKLLDCVKNWTLHVAVIIGCGVLISSSAKTKFLLNLAEVFNGCDKPVSRDILYLLSRPAARMLSGRDVKFICTNTTTDEFISTGQGIGKILDRLFMTEIFVYVANKINPSSAVRFQSHVMQLLYLQHLLDRKATVQVAGYLGYITENILLEPEDSVDSFVLNTIFSDVVANRNLLGSDSKGLFDLLSTRVQDGISRQRQQEITRSEEQMRKYAEMVKNAERLATEQQERQTRQDVEDKLAADSLADVERQRQAELDKQRLDYLRLTEKIDGLEQYQDSETTSTSPQTNSASLGFLEDLSVPQVELPLENLQVESALRMDKPPMMERMNSPVLTEPVSSTSEVQPSMLQPVVDQLRYPENFHFGNKAPEVNSRRHSNVGWEEEHLDFFRLRKKSESGSDVSKHDSDTQKSDMKLQTNQAVGVCGFGSQKNPQDEFSSELRQLRGSMDYGQTFLPEDFNGTNLSNETTFRVEPESLANLHRVDNNFTVDNREDLPSSNAEIPSGSSYQVYGSAYGTTEYDPESNQGGQESGAPYVIQGDFPTAEEYQQSFDQQSYSSFSEPQELAQDVEGSQQSYWNSYPQNQQGGNVSEQQAWLPQDPADQQTYADYYNSQQQYNEYSQNVETRQWNGYQTDCATQPQSADNRYASWQYSHNYYSPDGNYEEAQVDQLAAIPQPYQPPATNSWTYYEPQPSENDVPVSSHQSFSNYMPQTFQTEPEIPDEQEESESATPQGSAQFQYPGPAPASVPAAGVAENKTAKPGFMGRFTGLFRKASDVGHVPPVPVAPAYNQPPFNPASGPPVGTSAPPAMPYSGYSQFPQTGSFQPGWSNIPLTSGGQSQPFTSPFMYNVPVANQQVPGAIFTPGNAWTGAGNSLPRTNNGGSAPPAQMSQLNANVSHGQKVPPIY